jgi:hypothetical protein
VGDVRIKESIGYETARGIIDRHIAKEVDWQAIKNLKIIGIDELSLKNSTLAIFGLQAGCSRNKLLILLS